MLRPHSRARPRTTPSSSKRPTTSFLPKVKSVHIQHILGFSDGDEYSDEEEKDEIFDDSLVPFTTSHSTHNLLANNNNNNNNSNNNNDNDNDTQIDNDNDKDIENDDTNEDDKNDADKKAQDTNQQSNTLERAESLSRKILRMNQINIRRNEMIVADLLSDIDSDNLSLLKAEFLKKKVGVSLPEFVHIMRTYLLPRETPGSVSENSVVVRLCQLFSEIDVDNSQFLSWDEFLGYIIKNGFSLPVDGIPKYVSVGLEDPPPVRRLDKLIFLPKLNKLAVLDYNKEGVLRIYREENKEFKLFKNLPGVNLLNVTYIDDKGLFVTASTDCKMQIYDTLQNWRSVHTLSTVYPQLSLCYSPLVRTFFSGSTRGDILCWNPLTWKEKTSLKQVHNDYVMDLKVITNTSLLASGSLDNKIILWDTVLGVPSSELLGHHKGVISLAYSSEYRILVSAGVEREPLVWNPTVNSILYRLKGHHSPLLGVEAVEGTPELVSVDQNGTCKIWDIRTFECVQSFVQESPTHITSFTTICNTNRILLGDMTRVYCFEYDRPAKPWLTDRNPIISCAYNSHSHTILTLSAVDAKVWDAKNGTLLRTYSSMTKGQLTAATFDAGKRKLFIGSSLGELLILNYSSGHVLGELQSHTAEVSAIVYDSRFHQLFTTAWGTWGKDGSEKGGCISVHEEVGKSNGAVKTTYVSSDIIFASMSQLLGLLAAATPDRQILLLEIDRFVIEKQLRGNHEFFSLCFLDPYPVLACGDSMGMIYFYTVRPALFRNTLVLTLNTSEKVPTDNSNSNNSSANQRYEVDLMNRETDAYDNIGKHQDPNLDSNSNSNSSPNKKSSQIVKKGISALAFHGESKLLFSGTESGTIQTWHLTKFFNTLNLTPVNQTKQHNSFSNSPGVFSINIPLDSDVVLLEKTWAAHQDSITCLNIIDEPPAILSASKDRRVRSWGLNGTYFGTLRQSSPSWTLPINTEKNKADENALAAQVLDKANNIETDFEKYSDLYHRYLNSSGLTIDMDDNGKIKVPKYMRLSKLGIASNNSSPSDIHKAIFSDHKATSSDVSSRFPSVNDRLSLGARTRLLASPTLRNELMQAGPLTSLSFTNALHKSIESSRTDFLAKPHKDGDSCSCERCVQRREAIEEERLSWGVNRPVRSESPTRANDVKSPERTDNKNDLINLQKIRQAWDQENRLETKERPTTTTTNFERSSVVQFTNTELSKIQSLPVVGGANPTKRTSPTSSSKESKQKQSELKKSNGNNHNHSHNDNNNYHKDDRLRSINKERYEKSIEYWNNRKSLSRAGKKDESIREGERIVMRANNSPPPKV